MKVFLFEYASCGAFPELDPAMTVEGLGMFKTLLEGFRDILAFVDRRIPLDIVYPKVENYREMFSECLERADAALIIAPEPKMEHYNLVVELEKTGCANLGSSSDSVRHTTDKYSTFKKLKGVRTPKTWVHTGKGFDGFPLVAKPRDGVSCNGIFMVRDEGDLERVPKGYILQEYVPGRSYSAGLLVGEETRIISINTQEIEDFVYKGAVVPALLEMSRDDEEQLLRTVECFKGLNGYVGVDFVYDEGVVVIEVNARPTTPIIAMEMVYGYNPGELILRNYEGKVIPSEKPKRRVRLRKLHSSLHRNGESTFVEFGGCSIALSKEKIGGHGR